MVFDKWACEVNNWVEFSELREKTAIRLLLKYVSGEAATYYMDFVVGNENAMTLDMFFENLFDYCFPRDFKDKLRAKLTTSTQGKRRVREFLRDLMKLAARFPDVNERTVIETFWHGMCSCSYQFLCKFSYSLVHTLYKNSERFLGASLT